MITVFQNKRIRVGISHSTLWVYNKMYNKTCTTNITLLTFWKIPVCHHSIIHNKSKFITLTCVNISDNIIDCFLSLN